VFFVFPKFEQERKLLEEYHVQDAKSAVLETPKQGTPIAVPGGK
jgi:hypothetical protein